MSVATANKVVSIHYTLRDSDGEVVDSSEGKEALAYLHGAHNIVPGLEKQLEGKSAGDKLKTEVPPEEGYGIRSGPGVQAVPRQAFGNAPIQEGMSIVVEDQDGNHTPLWIVEVQDSQVLVDTNHPLAGETLHFEVEVIGVRDASEEELAQGGVAPPAIDTPN